MGKKAVLVGCNYPGTDAALRGCVNDVMTMKELLTTYKGFDEDDIRILIDTDSSAEQPTGKNIRDALSDLCSGAQDGDVLFFHFSGHGTQVPVMFDPEEPDKKNEALCPTDMNLIIDDDLRDIVNRVSPDAKLTLITDCCHSGGMLDHDAVQIEGDKAATRDIDPSEMQVQSRELPISGVASLLSNMLGKQVPPQGVQGALGEVHGRNASKFLYNPAVEKIINSFGAKFGLGNNAAGMVQMAMGAMGQSSSQQPSSGGGNPLGSVMSMLGGGGGGSSGGSGMGALLGGFLGGSGGASGGGGGGSSGGGSLDIGSFVSALTSNPEQRLEAVQELQNDPDMPSRPNKISDEIGVLITGCQSSETSADVCEGDAAFGALSNAVKNVVARDPSMSYYELVTQVRGFLHDKGMSQNPCLECSYENKDKPFIC